MNYNKIVAFLSFFLFSACVYAQENFMPGFVIMPTGDTLKGLIDNQNWRINPEFIRFKQREAAVVVSYYPSDIKAFAILKEEYYESISAMFDYVSRDVKDIGLQDRQNLIQDNVFAMVVYQSELSLLRSVDKKNDELHFIIRKKGAAPEALAYRRFLTEVNGKSSIREVNVYKSQLSAAISNGCPSLSGTISGLNYNEKSLLAFVKAYNECVGAMAAYEKKVEKLKIQAGVVAGMSFNQLGFSGNSGAFPDLENGDFKSSFQPVGGIWLDLIFPRNRKKWSLYNELAITSYKTSDEYERTQGDQLSYYYENDIFFSYLKLFNALRYRVIQQENGSIFFQLGMGNGALIKKDNKKVTVTTNLSGPYTEVGGVMPLIRTYEQSIIAGGGYSNKYGNIELRFERGNGFSKFPALGAHTNWLHLLLCVKLF